MASFHEQKIQQAFEDLRTKKFDLVNVSYVLVATESVSWMNLFSVYLGSELTLTDTQTIHRPGVL
jgi:hypothetical protein